MAFGLTFMVSSRDSIVFYVVTRLGNGAKTGGAERCRRDAERGVEGSDKSKVGRNSFDL